MSAAPQAALCLAIYARASRDPKEMAISVTTQLGEGRELAAREYPTAEVREYVDNDRSASDPDAYRPAYAQLLADLAAGEVDVIVALNQSRLARTYQWEQLMRLLTSQGITHVHTMQKGLVDVRLGRRTAARLDNFVDIEQVERITVNNQNTHRRLAAEGRPQGVRPYGFVSFKTARGDDGRPVLQPDPAEAKIVRRIYREAEKGKALGAIGASLDRQGVPTPKGGKFWRNDTIAAILRSPSVAGLRRNGDGLVACRGEGIITPDRFYAMQDRLSNVRQVRCADGTLYPVQVIQQPRRRRPRKHLLSGADGVLRCGRCGSPMHIIASNRSRPGHVMPTVPGYGCTPQSGPDACRGVTISPAGAVEDHIKGELFSRLDAPRVKRLLGASREPRRAAALLELAEAKRDAEAIAEQFADLPRNIRERMIRSALVKVDELQAAAGDIVDAADDLPPAEQIEAKWDSLSIQARRAILSRVIESVTVAPATHRRRFDPSRLSVKWRR
jgi:site-specific DNA recombinase